jgi:integrase
VRLIVLGEPSTAKPKTITLAGRDRAHGVRIGDPSARNGATLSRRPMARRSTSSASTTGGKLTPRVKTDAGERLVAVLPSLAQELMRPREDTSYAIWGRPDLPSLTGTRLDAHNGRRVLREAAEAAGVPLWTRTSCAEPRHRLHERGYRAAVIAKLLGHTDEAFTARVHVHTKDAPRFDAHDAAVRIVTADG